MEQLDLVDELDQVIGVTDKEEAHAEGHIHRMVAVYVFDPGGRLYVQHHKSGLLDHSAGGHAVCGEEYDDAAVREAKEELRLIEPLERLAVFYADERLWKNSTTQQRHMQGLYECRPSPEWRFSPTYEVKKITPMTLDEIVAGMNYHPRWFTPGFILSMAKYIQVRKLELDLTVPALYSV